MTSSLGQSLRSRLPIYTSDVSSFGRQSLLMILLLIVSSYSNPSTYGNLGTFLVHLSIVLSLRKAPIGLVYKPTYVFPCPLASSTHQLPSNLVPSLGLSLVSVSTDFDGYAINLKEQQLFFDNCSTKVSPRLIAFAVALLRRRPPLITVGTQDLQAFAHCCPSRSPRNSMCPHTTLECALLEI